MEQIDPSSAAFHFSNTVQKESLQKKEQKKTKRLSFADMLGFGAQAVSDSIFVPPEVAGLPLEEAIIKLKDKVDVAGDNMKAGASMESFAAYRKAVSDFMGFIVYSNYNVEMHESGRNILRRKRYYTLRIVDEKMDQLAADLLVNHCDKLRMLARIDEINGILVDLLT